MSNATENMKQLKSSQLLVGKKKRIHVTTQETFPMTSAFTCLFTQQKHCWPFTSENVR